MKPSWQAVKRDGYLPIATAYTNVVNQRMALPVTYLAWRAGLTPNALTLGSAVLTAVAITLIARAGSVRLGESLLIYLLLKAAYVLDSSDGQLARVAGVGSKFGAWLDHFLDGAKIVALNLAFGWFLVRRQDPGEAYMAAVLNTFFQAMLFFGSKLKAAQYGTMLAERLGTAHRAVRVLSLPFELLDWGLFIGFAWLMPWPRRFFEAYFVYGIFSAAVTMAYFGYSSLQMTRADKRGGG